MVRLNAQARGGFYAGPTGARAHAVWVCGVVGYLMVSLRAAIALTGDATSPARG
jgi:hypothetical protein